VKRLLLRAFGWKAIMLDGDPCLADRWRWVARHLEDGPLRTLDAGSGAGALTLYAATIGNDSLGISYNGQNTEKATAAAEFLGIENVRFLTADLRELTDYAGELGAFDQIVCCETLEHIKGDREVVSGLASLLEPGGKFLLTTPYKHYRPLLFDEISWREDGRHVRWGYTHAEVREIFEECGLQVVAEEYVSGVVSQQLTNLWRMLKRENATLAWTVVLPLRLLYFLDAPLTKTFNYPHHCIGMVAVKRR
jgi:2-polyprenyl-3-methyl-5-hydroxy-6-metoxy-1,4-benzoquinol methylase